MALTFGKGNRSIAFAPTAAFPLNANSYFESYELALAAALTAKPAGDTTTKYYFGQEIAVAEMIDNVPQSAKLYIIAPEVQEDGSVVGTLQEVGSATNGDGASIELVDGVLSVKDFGKRYYKYVAAVEGGEAANYELTEGWIAGLEPKVVEVDGEMVIGWYQPNPTTAEGVKDQVVEVQGEVEQAKEDIKAAEEAIETLESSVAEAEEAIEGINNALYGAGEGEEAVAGLIERVETLEGEMDAVQPDVATLKTDVAGLKTAVGNVYTKEETYTKEDVNDLVSNAISGVFHFRGSVESFEKLPAEKAEGDVYQVVDKEYAWNGTEWVELGFLVDLSSYATRTYVDEAVKAVADDLDLAEEAIEALEGADVTINGRLDGHDEAIEDLQGADTAIGERIDGIEEDISALVEEDERLAGLIGGHDERIEALETAKTGFDTHFETVDGQIKALQEADTAFDGRLTTVEGFDTRIGTLETNVGSPSTLQTALFPAVEALQARIDGLVAVGGEANLINGLTINGTALIPNAEKIIDLPIYNGTMAGLVPVAAEGVNTSNYVLAATGDWVNPFGNLNDLTVEAYVNQKVEEIAIEWTAI